MFIWDFVADKILGQIVDWFYGQVVGFLGNFFAEMGNMGVELFEMSWVQSIVLFFSYLAWALYGTGLVVACFECGIEYSSGRQARRCTGARNRLSLKWYAPIASAAALVVQGRRAREKCSGAQ